MGPAPQRASAPVELHRDRAGIRRVPEAAGAGAGDPQLQQVAAAFRGFLEALGLDLGDPDLAGTGLRVARAYREMLGGLRPEREPHLSTFPNTERYSNIVSVTGIPFYSICAHHFLPFFGVAHVGYVPGDRLVGLSKLSRVVDFFARRPQLQERLTEQVATLLEQRLAPAGVIVTLEARHLCMEMRGVARPNVSTTTTAARGTLAGVEAQRTFLARLRSQGGAAGHGLEAG